VVIVPWGTDSSEFGGATRVYWTFKYLGHDAVSILDGGWRQYDAQGGERAAEPATPVVAEFPLNVRPELRATTADVETALADGVPLVDGRPVEQYLGQSKSPVVRVEGTIPGAVNLPHSGFYSADYASFATPETIAALAKGVGIDESDKNIVFCNTGHWASIAWFALSEVQGNKNTAMYDGSMAEWAADPARPIQLDRPPVSAADRLDVAPGRRSIQQFCGARFFTIMSDISLSPVSTPKYLPPVTSDRWPLLVVAVALLAGFLLITAQVDLRQGALFLIGGALGATLYNGSFGVGVG